MADIDDELDEGDIDFSTWVPKKREKEAWADNVGGELGKVIRASKAGTTAAVIATKVGEALVRLGAAAFKA